MTNTLHVPIDRILGSTLVYLLIVRERLAAAKPVVAHAEVLDKELSLPAIASLALLGAIAAFLADRHRPWLLAVIVPPLALLFG